MRLFRKKPAPPRRRVAADGASESSREREAIPERNAFQRNRTLTGSSSSRITTVNEANADMRSPRVHAHELTRKRRHLGSLFLLVLLIAGGLSLLVYQFTARVTVALEKNVVASVDQNYEPIIQEYLSTHPAERLRVLLNTDQLSLYMQTKAPEVASVTVKGWSGFGSSEIAIGVRQPIAGWSIQGSQRYVDASGISFARNYYATPGVQIIDKSGTETQAGQSVASNRFLGFVGRVVGIAGTKGVTVTEVTIPPATTRQIELRLEGVAYPVKMTIDRPAGEQVEDMTRAIEWLKAGNKGAQYVDVRVSGKAFYK